MNPGSLVITAIPQSDGVRKNRPALLLFRLPPFGDALVCGVSSQLRLFVAELDELIEPQNEDFQMSGLSVASIVRVVYLASVPLSEIKGRIGKITPERYQRMVDRLTRYLRSRAGLSSP